MLKLQEQACIGKGAERKCYVHPEYDDRVIKIEYIEKKDRDQNRLDVLYYAHIAKKDISFSHIAKYHNKADTNYGKGLVFEYIKDYNKQPSCTLENIIKKEVLSKKTVDTLLTELQHYLEKNCIVFGDVVLSNILCQQTAAHKWKLVIIDGLGARRIGWKLWLQMHSKWYTSIRIKKQWRKLLIQYNELIETT